MYVGSRTTQDGKSLSRDVTGPPGHTLALGDLSTQTLSKPQPRAVFQTLLGHRGGPGTPPRSAHLQFEWVRVSGLALPPHLCDGPGPLPVGLGGEALVAQQVLEVGLGHPRLWGCRGSGSAERHSGGRRGRHCDAPEAKKPRALRVLAVAACHHSPRSCVSGSVTLWDQRTAGESGEPPTELPGPTRPECGAICHLPGSTWDVPSL